MKRKTARMRFHLYFLILCFLMVNHTMPSTLVYAQPSEAFAVREIFSDVTAIRIPKQIGEVQEFYRGSGEKIFVLVQDAHSIPDAQNSTRALIKFFEQTYGFDLTLLEGASTELDAQIFKSFPEQNVLKDVFKSYMSEGELTGGTAAAIFNEGQTIFHGIEDWPLYEEQINTFLKSIEVSERIEKELAAYQGELDRLKKENYSRELLELDRAWMQFDLNKINLVELIQAMAKIKEPGKDSKIEAILSISNENNPIELDFEIKRIAKKVNSALRSAPPSPGTRNDMKEFNLNQQEYGLSRMSAEAFGLYLKKLIVKYRIPIQVSQGLSEKVNQQKTMQDIRGTQLFRELENYDNEVKEVLFQNDTERRIDLENTNLQLIRRLTQLELSQEDWVKVENVAGRLKEMSLFSDGVLTPDILDDLFQQLGSNFEFYRIARARDKVFIDQSMKLLQRYKKKKAMLVTGGFHTEGLTRSFRQSGVSYVLVTPAIQSLPKESHYRDHMQGKVSWSNYFEVEDGKVSLYDAFVRGTRAQLLSKSSEEQGLLLKKWRDQIIRDLAEKGNVSQAKKYLKFIDEVYEEDSDLGKLRELWLEKIDQFIAGMRGLDQKGQMSEQNVLGLMNSVSMAAEFATAGAIAGNPISAIHLRNVIPAEQIPTDALTTVVSELRSVEEVDEALILAPVVISSRSEMRTEDAALENAFVEEMEKIGYSNIERIGSGEQVTAFKAVRVNGDVVALKFVREMIGSDTPYASVEAMQELIQKLGKHRHKNVEQIYEVHTISLPGISTPHTYVVSEFVEGVTLEKYFKNASYPLSAEDVDFRLDIVEQIIEGINFLTDLKIQRAYAHLRNIMLNPDTHRVVHIDYQPSPRFSQYSDQLVARTLVEFLTGINTFRLVHTEIGALRDDKENVRAKLALRFQSPEPLEQFTEFTYAYLNQKEGYVTTQDIYEHVKQIRSELRSAEEQVKRAGELLEGELGQAVGSIVLNALDSFYAYESELQMIAKKEGLINPSDLSSVENLRELFVSELEKLNSEGKVVGLQTLFNRLRSNESLTTDEQALLLALTFLLPKVSQSRADEENALDTLETKINVLSQAVIDDLFLTLKIKNSLATGNLSIARNACKVCPHSSAIVSELLKGFVKSDFGSNSTINIMIARVGPNPMDNTAARHLWTQISAELIDASGKKIRRNFYVSLVDSQFEEFGFDESLEGHLRGRVNVVSFEDDMTVEKAVQEKSKVVLSGARINKRVSPDYTLLDDGNERSFVERFQFSQGMGEVHEAIAEILLSHARGDEIVPVEDNTDKNKELRERYGKTMFFFMINSALTIAGKRNKTEERRKAIHDLDEAVGYFQKYGQDFKLLKRSEVEKSDIDALLIMLSMAQYELRKDKNSQVPEVITVERIIETLEAFELDSDRATMRLPLQYLKSLKEKEEQYINEALQAMQKTERLTEEYLQDQSKLQDLVDFLGSNRELLKLSYLILMRGFEVPESDERLTALSMALQTQHGLPDPAQEVIALREAVGDKSELRTDTASQDEKVLGIAQNIISEDVLTEIRKKVKTEVTVIKTSNSRISQEDAAQAAIQITESEGLEALKEQLVEAVIRTFLETGTGHKFIWSNEALVVLRQEIQTLIALASKLQDRELTVAALMPSDAERVQNVPLLNQLLKLTQSGEGKLSEFIVNGQIPVDVQQEFDAHGVLVRSLKLNRKQILMNDQAAVPLLVLADQIEQINGMFVPLKANMENVDGPMMIDYAELVRSVVALHMADLIAGDESLLNNNERLKEALIVRLEMFGEGFSDVISHDGNGWVINGAVARAYMEMRIAAVVAASA